MTFLLITLITLLIIATLTAIRENQKTSEVKCKEDVAEDPKSLTLYQDYLEEQGYTGPIDPVLLSRIRKTFGETTATPFFKHPVNNQGTKTVKKPQTLRNRTTNHYRRDEDSRTSFYDLDFVLAADYDLNTSRPSHSDIQYNQDHSCHDSGSNHSSHDYGSHDCGGHDFSSFD